MDEGLVGGLRLWYRGGCLEEVTEKLSTSVIAVMGKRGSGKTYFSGVLEEELAERGIPFIVLDPMRAHYTIREKYNVLILGGVDTPFVDAYIDYRVGGEVAMLVSEANLSTVIDLSWMDREKQETFVRDLCWKLLEASRKPRMVLLEEADVFTPQSRSSESREAVDALIRRGRAFGLGAAVISQRPAIVSKDALSQADVYLFFRLISPRDIEAVKEMLEYTGASQAQIKDTLSQLPRLASGEAILYSPELLKTLDIVKVRRRMTTHAAEAPSLVLEQSAAPTPPQFSEIAEKLREVLKKKELEETELETLRRLVRGYEEKIKSLEEEVREYRKQIEILKAVREMPVEVKIETSTTQPIEASKKISVASGEAAVPETVSRCPYKGAEKVYQYLLRESGYTSLREINMATGVGFETVKKIINYFRKKGLLKAETVSIYGKQYVRRVKLKGA